MTSSSTVDHIEPRPADQHFDVDSAPDTEPQPAAAEALEWFNRELKAAINEEFGSQPF